MANAPAKKKINMWRRSTNVRMGIIIVLLLIVIALGVFFEKMRLWMIGIGIFLLAALGMEIGGTDFDIGEFVRTGSLSESRIEKTDSGTWLHSDDCRREALNCSNFSYQEEAQEVFISCGGLDNDIHNLDGDNDGKVCEALPSRGTEAIAEEAETEEVTVEEDASADAEAAPAEETEDAPAAL